MIVACFCVSVSGADPAPEAADRGITRDAAPTGIDYARKWAVVVGCNYAGNPHPRSVPTLRSAENDARAVYDELVRNYGYEADKTCFLLLGSAKDTGQATRDRILDVLKDVVGRCNLETGTGADAPKHSLLFFFAGHGAGFRSGKAAYGKLFPVDVTVDVAGDEPVMGNTLFIPEIVEYVDGCRAFHKLIILDCCESGLLFEDFKAESDDAVERSAGGNAAARTDFTAAAIVGLTAGTQTERVKDSTDLAPGHSPFTGALLQGLSTALGEPGAGPFAATELYVDITRQLEKFNAAQPQAAVTQRPQIGKLPVGMAGDFFFVPRAGFSPAVSAPAATATALAGLGGLTGAAWMDQWPWFTPAIRAALPAIDRALAAGGKTLEVRLRESLGMSAGRALIDAPPAALMDRLHDVLDDHRLSLDAPGTAWQDFATLSDAALTADDRSALLAEVRTRIAAAPCAADLHLAALLEARLGQPVDAEQHFDAALKLLAADPAARPLVALCHLDFAQFLLGAGRWKDCVAACERARRTAGDAPGSEYLRIEAACVQAAALRKRNRQRDAEELFAGPIAAATASIAARGVTLHPTLASVAERHSWCLMDQWRLAEAAAGFQRSVELRSRLGGSADEGAALVHRLNELHSRHGLAMIAHFTSERDADGPVAERRYAEIADTCDELLPRPAREEVLILERAVNSLERLADSMLLVPGESQRHPTRAAAVLGQAMRREELRQRRSGTDGAGSPLARLHLKRSIALLLDGEAEAAATERAAADTLLHAAAAPPADRTINLLAAIADVLAGGAGGRGAILEAVKDLAEPAAGSPLAGREEVDVALFSVAITARRIPAGGVGDDAPRLLTGLLDTFNELGDAREPLLRYLRQYRDVVVDVLAAHATGDAVADVADAVVASRGDARFAEADDTDVVVLLHVFDDDRRWLAIAQPALAAAGAPAARLVRGADRLPPLAAKGSLPPPPQLLAAVDGLAATGGKTVVKWSDPVLGLHAEDFPFDLPTGWSLAAEAAKAGGAK